jgi:hypothetical protein
VSACTRCEGWGCRQCTPVAEQLESAGGEQGLRADELELIRLRQEVTAAWEALGAAWKRDGVSLAEAIKAKCDTLEGVRP